MHVKEQVKEFVHDVKRKFSKKHNRDSTCSTCAVDSHDGASFYSSTDTYGTADDSTSSSDSSLHGTPQRRRRIPFIHPRTPSTPSKLHNMTDKVKRAGSKRYRLFSAPSMPSMRVAAPPQSSHRQVVTEPSMRGPIRESGSLQEVSDGSRTIGFSQEDSDIIDISARSVNMGSDVPEQRTSLDSAPFSQPQFDTYSAVSGTLITAASSGFRKSVSDSDYPVDIIRERSDEDSSCPPAASMAHPTPATPAQIPISSADDEEITLVQSISTLSLAPPPSTSPPQALRTIAPTQPTRSAPASPAPVYIPRLTAPSMFLPIPNTDPLSALLTKYVPAEQRPRRDIVGEYTGRDVHEMVMSNSWRALAKMARDRIVASDPEDLARILDLWSLRLSALARLRLTNQACAECTNLFAVLNAVHPTSAPGSFPGSGSLPPSIPLPPSPAPTTPLPLSPSGLGGLAQLPGTPSQKPSALPSTHASRHGANELLHPFELIVFHARVHYWSGDPLGYVDALSRILGRCKERAREEGRIVAQRRGLLGKAERPQSVESASTSGSDETDGDGGEEEEEEEEESAEDSEEDTTRAQVDDGDDPDEVLVAAEANLSMWLERIARVCLMLASQMIEMNDYQAAINLLAPLCTHRVAPALEPIPSPELHSALARVYLLCGNLGKAEEYFSVAASAAANSANGTDMIAMNTALLAAASGDWPRAEEALVEMIAGDPGNFAAINNLAVTSLCQGNIKRGIDLLEAAMQTSPSSVVVAEPFLFNLSTLYELRSAAAIDKKRELLVQVAQWSGDGLRTTCLKMPSS